MLSALRQGRVAGLRVTVACARSLDAAAYDVYLIDLGPAGLTGAGRFDEVPYLEYLEPVLEAAGGPPAWVVDISRTHRSDRDGLGRAHLVVHLGTGGTLTTEAEPDLAGLVKAAFARMAGLDSALSPREQLARSDAIVAATSAVEHAFSDVDPTTLSLTDEEHLAQEGLWSVGLAVPGVTRFHVQLGFVPGVPESAHVRRMPLSEVVDSVGP